MKHPPPNKMSIAAALCVLMWSCVRVYLSADLDLITTITPSQKFTNQNQRLTLDMRQIRKKQKNNEINENV